MESLYEATDDLSLYPGADRRECQYGYCDGRHLDGQVFGRGFDSRQVHQHDRRSYNRRFDTDQKEQLGFSKSSCSFFFFIVPVKAHQSPEGTISNAGS